MKKLFFLSMVLFFLTDYAIGQGWHEPYRLDSDSKDTNSKDTKADKYMQKYLRSNEFESKIFIGMSKEQALDALGRPKWVKKTVTSSGTHEQWLYKTDTYHGLRAGRCKYLYFDNDILRNWEDKPGIEGPTFKRYKCD